MVLRRQLLVVWKPQVITTGDKDGWCPLLIPSASAWLPLHRGAFLTWTTEMAPGGVLQQGRRCTQRPPARLFTFCMEPRLSGLLTRDLGFLPHTAPGKAHFAGLPAARSPERLHRSPRPSAGRSDKQSGCGRGHRADTHPHPSSFPRVFPSTNHANFVGFSLPSKRATSAGALS